MSRCFLPEKYLYLSIFLLLSASVNSLAQTCTGSLGDPIVNITFGSGTNFGAPLAQGTTSSLQYQADICPVNGYYSIVNYTSGCWANDVVWHTTTDHTGDPNGYFMLIDASWEPSNFYIQTIDGLCSGTTYEFAAWFLNMCSLKGILPNITFTIEKTDGTILGSYNTGDIPIINPVTWKKYGMFFTTPAGITSVVLRMRNNAPGGTGNDLALDDITFRPAGPAIVGTVTGSATTTINTCANKKETFELNATVDNCYINTAYQWQISTNNGIGWANIAGATTKVYTRLPTIAGKYLYRLKAAEAGNINVSNCSVSSAIITINVNETPEITVSNNGLKCTGNKLTLNATGGVNYNWSGPDNFIASGSEVTFNNVLLKNSGKYSVIVADSFGCINTNSTMVELYSTPIADFKITTPFCEKNSIAFTDQSIGFEQSVQKWNWSFGDSAASTLQSIRHIYSIPGSYPVSLSVSNAKGCSSLPVTKLLVVSALPKADFILPVICLADPLTTFISTSSISDSSQPQFIYRWNFADVNATPSNPNFSGLSSPQHAYKSAGDYLVQLNIISNNGCSDSLTKKFTVNGADPKAKFFVDGGNSFCSNESIVLTDQSTVDFGTIRKVEIYWDFLNDTVTKFTDLSPVFSKKYTHQYPVFGLPLTKLMKVRYVVYSGINCVNETTQIIEIKGNPRVEFTPLNSICGGAAVIKITQGKELTGIAGAGIYSGTGVSAIGLFDPSVPTPGPNIIRYTFTSSGNCIAFAQQNIMVFAQPYTSAGADRTMIRGGNLTLQATATGNNLQYEWLPDIAMDNNHILNPKVSPVQDILYHLKVSSPDGCVTGSGVKVFVLKEIFIPSAFSPNGDGINDTWRIPFLESYSGASIQVYNRNGEMVYHSDAKFNNWDGTFKGIKLPAGSYAWILNTGVAKKVLYGMVTIVL